MQAARLICSIGLIFLPELSNHAKIENVLTIFLFRFFVFGNEYLK